MLRNLSKETAPDVIYRVSPTSQQLTLFFSLLIKRNTSIDATQLDRFKTTFAEVRPEEILSATIKAALNIGAVKKNEFERLIIDRNTQLRELVRNISN